MHMVDAIGKNAAVSAVSRGTAEDASRVVNDFYGALGKRDFKTMAQSYAPNVKFHDPLFGTLHGTKATMDMWKTSLSGIDPKTFKAEHTVQPNPTRNPDGSYNVKVHWDAHYDVGLLRKHHVENHADSTFVVKDGKITSQRDDWSLNDWTKQAFPGVGGHKLTNKLTHFVAHGFIELKDGWKAR
jgi:limonene-1,2-epoxide hydrolase